MFMFAICCRPSVCHLSVCLSVTLVHLLSWLKFLAMFLRHLLPWPSVDNHRNFMKIVPGEPLLRGGGDLNARGIAKYRDFGPTEGYISETISRKRCKIGGKLVLITNRKSYMSFRLVPRSVTLNDLKRRNGRYFSLFQRIRVAPGRTA